MGPYIRSFLSVELSNLVFLRCSILTSGLFEEIISSCSAQILSVGAGAGYALVWRLVRMRGQMLEGIVAAPEQQKSELPAF